jgi:hypothetical protein
MTTPQPATPLTQCPACAAAVQPGQRFCGSCGVMLSAGGVPGGSAGQTAGAPGDLPPATPPPAAPPDAPPVATPATPAPPATPSAYDPTTTLTVVEQTGYDGNFLPPTPPATPATTPPWSAAPVGSPSQFPTEQIRPQHEQHQQAQYQAPYQTQPQPQYQQQYYVDEIDARRGRIPLYVAAALTIGAGIASLVLRLFSFDAQFDGGSLNDSLTAAELSSNAPIGLVIGMVVMAIGTVLSGTGSRLGAGLAGGAGLGMASLAATMMALVVSSYDGAAETVPAAGAFVLTRTYEAGFFTLVGVVGAGLFAFFVSVWAGGSESRSPMHPAVAALGALAAVVAAASPLIPVDGAALVDNFGGAALTESVAAVRLVALALLLLAGVVGFLNRRMWGLGAVLGAFGVALWIVVSREAEVGDSPVALGLGNLFSGEQIVATIAGVAATLVLALLALATMQRTDR